MDQRVRPGMQRQKPRLLALAVNFEVRHAAARESEIRNLELAQLLAPQRVVEQCRQDGAVALGLDGFLRRRRQNLARLVIANCRRRAFAALGLGPLYTFDRVLTDGVLFAEILEQ